MDNKICGSETNHMDFTNHNTCLNTLDMGLLLVHVLFAGDNHTAAHLENQDNQYDG